MPKVAPGVVAPPPAGSLDLSPNRSYKHDLWPKNKGLDSTPEDFKWASPSAKPEGDDKASTLSSKPAPQVMAR